MIVDFSNCLLSNRNLQYAGRAGEKRGIIYDGGNCFYSKTDDDRISLIMSDEKRLIESSVNCITAYEDEEGNNIHFVDLLNTTNQNLIESIEKVLTSIEHKKEEIINFINSIDNEYNDIIIASELRKKYYLKTLELRINILKDYINSINN